MKSVDRSQTTCRWFVSNVHNRAHLMEVVRFIVCGVVNTAVTFLMYLSLLWVASYAVAYTLSYVAGIFIAYWLNAKFVFQEPLSVSRALQYPLVYLVQYVLGLALLFLLVELAHLSKVIAPLVVVILTLPVTFFLSRYLIRRSFGLKQPGRTP